MLGNFSCFCCHLLTFSETQSSVNLYPGYADILIWIQIICNGYQLTIKIATSKERVKAQIMSTNFIASWKINFVVLWEIFCGIMKNKFCSIMENK